MYVRNAFSNVAESLDVSACGQHPDALHIARTSTVSRDIYKKVVAPGHALHRMYRCYANGRLIVITATLLSAHRIVGGAVIRDGGANERAPVQRQAREVVLREVDCTPAHAARSASLRARTYTTTTYNLDSKQQLLEHAMLFAAC